MANDIFKIPNLISLGRLFLLIPVAYLLAQPDPVYRFYTLIVLTVAAVSDFLDGYLARRLNQKTELGLLLDPLSDKILAGVLVILLIIYREFPIWLAAVILTRDLLILAGGLVIKSKIGRTPPSNLSGKYCFAAIAVLLISYVILYAVGIWLMTICTLVLIVVSLMMYIRSFMIVIVAGLSNVAGVVFAGLGLGAAENFAGFLLGAEFQAAFVFSLLVFILLYRNFKLRLQRRYLK